MPSLRGTPTASAAKSQLWFAISSDYEISPEFSNMFSFPNLLYLEIVCSALSPDVLPDLYAQLKYRLEALELHGPEVGPILIPILRQLPALHRLSLEFCCVDDGLFKIFTYDSEPVTSFALPQLTSLTIIENN
ncbi:hypothetical protein FB451DRAFT_1405400 [Mycena latifolia]|nr:hypothetical protein FB451DRAFT_1405400 [Mycena latifolia]